MRIEKPDRRTRSLLKDDGAELARITRTSWMGHKAELLAGGEIYQLQTASFRNKLTLAYQGTSLLEITFQWATIHIKNLMDPSLSFVIKQKSVWRSEYEIQGASGNLIAAFRFKMDWKKFCERIELNAPDTAMEACPPWILLSAVYAVIVKRSRQAAAAA